MRPSTASRAVVALLAVTALSGCNLSSLQLTNDRRLTFSTPQARTRVKTPLVISWTMKDFDAAGLTGAKDPHEGVFAVFVDSAPMPAGKDLKWLARDDKGCAHDAECPSKPYLTARNVFLTTDPTLTVTLLPRQSDGVGDEQHYVNVVLLDGTGTRIGESAWYLPFTSKRRTAA